MCRLGNGRFRKIGNNQVLISEWQPDRVLLQRIARLGDMSLRSDARPYGALHWVGSRRYGVSPELAEETTDTCRPRTSFPSKVKSSAFVAAS